MKIDIRHNGKLYRLAAALVCAAALAAAHSGHVAANGFGENGSYQFRSDADRNVRLNVERTRLQRNGDLGVGSAAGLGAFTSQGGQPTGNSIVFEGDNNTITQTNNGSQSSNNQKDSSGTLSPEASTTNGN